MSESVVIIPTYNEIGNIENTLKNVEKLEIKFFNLFNPSIIVTPYKHLSSRLLVILDFKSNSFT